MPSICELRWSLFFLRYKHFTSFIYNIRVALAGSYWMGGGGGGANKFWPLLIYINMINLVPCEPCTVFACTLVHQCQIECREEWHVLAVSRNGGEGGGE